MAKNPKHAKTKIELRDISSIFGADYNPRKMVPERLRQVAVSLAKLGFLLPVYITPEGKLLSGHQRTKAAALYGYTRVPVEVTTLDELQEKGINMVFNKGTNDLDTFETDAKKAFEDYLETSTGLIESLPDIPPDTYYPCMETHTWEIGHAINCAGSGVSDSLREAGSTLVGAGVCMPLVVCGDQILNGKGRAWGYANKSFDTVEVVEVSPERADYAFLALNFLAMDFDIQKNFVDELRYNAYRRRSVQRSIVGLSKTYTQFVYNRAILSTKGKYFMMDGEAGNPDLMLLPTATEEARKKFENTYGRDIIDMGAGTLHDSQLMNQAGFNVIPYEPFFCREEDDTPIRDIVRDLVQLPFLHAVKRLGHKGPDSIISSFVLNSIPHHVDRVAYLTVMAALCRYSTKVFIGTQHTDILQGNNLNTHLRLNGDEPNMTLGNSTRFFKAQKYYTVNELQKLLNVFFVKVEIKKLGNNVFAKCAFGRRPNPRLLAEALDMAFECPYKDGSRLGLSGLARAVFSEYLGMEIPVSGLGMATGL